MPSSPRAEVGVVPRRRILNAVLLVATFTALSNADSSPDNGWASLVAWMKSHHGQVDDRFTVTETGGVRGAVALADIEEGATLLNCPWNLVIGSSGLHDQMQDMCSVVRQLEVEFRLGQESLWHPYLELDDSLINSRLPTLWDASALAELQGLPPQDDAMRHLLWYSRDCSEGPVERLADVTKQAILSFVTRASAVGMVPIYDLLNHHNGERNAKLVPTEDAVQLVTLRPIQAGAQIYLSYGIKSASTMYRDYGFVESWPQIWTWIDGATAVRQTFVLFPDDVAAIHPTPEILREFWSTSMPLDEHQARAVEHTRQLSRDLLDSFQAAARDLLIGLPTTVEQDEGILDSLKDSLLASDDDGAQVDKVANLKDRISAVEYRINVKKAVGVSLRASGDSLRSDEL